MWRFGLIVAIVAGCYALPEGVPAKPELDRDRVKVKVALCHFPGLDSLGVQIPPHVIVVSENAVDAHLRNHGDCVVADTLQAGEACECEGR